MRLPDPLKIQYTIRSTHVQTEIFQNPGIVYQSVYSNENDIFAVTQGPSHKETIDAAVWMVRLAKERKTYWKDKKLLASRITKSVQRALDHQSNKSSTSTWLSLLLFSERNYYCYHAGNTSIVRYRDNQIQRLTSIQTRGFMTHTNPPVLECTTGILRSGDTFLLCSDAVSQITDTQLISWLDQKSDRFIELNPNLGMCLVSYMIY